MSEDLEEWLKYAMNISQNKVVERCKNSIQSIKTKTIIAQPHIKAISTRKQHCHTDNYISLNDTKCVERSIIKKLKHNAYPIDITIDLHGYTVEQAYEIFIQAFFYTISQQYKLMLVITGKGDKIRPSLQRWINNPSIAQYIIYFTGTANRNEMDGAFYLLLRS